MGPRGGKSSAKGKALSGWEGLPDPDEIAYRPSSQQVPVPGTRQENGMATRLDEGLEDFFSRRVMDESSRCGT